MLTRVEFVVADMSMGRLSHWSSRMRSAFPTLDIAFVQMPAPRAWCIDMTEWCDPALCFWEFDRRVDEAFVGGATTVALLIPGPASFGEGLGVVTRCQRWIGRRNRHTRGAVFDAALRAHRQVYDLHKPLVLADYRHALDTWQWILRLDAEASASLQLAALFHDIERIASESDLRVEHLARNYEGFKAAHARRGSEMTRLLLRDVPISRDEGDRVAELVARHETPAEDEELALLNDADALSFFSLNSAGFFDYFGAAHTARKIRYTLARMRTPAVAALSTVRLRADVAELTWQSMGAVDALHAAGAP
jgi:hypothetical protein